MNTLKVFKESEIIFNEEEAREILIRFFPADRNKIMVASITTELISFAQALLLEAIDASFSIGIVKGLWKSTLNPRAPFKKVIEKLITSLGPHFFHHATTQDLRNVEIYQFVVDALNQRFKSDLNILLSGIAIKNPLILPRYEQIISKRVWV
ncbi:hypothetical protein [Vibrio sp. B1FLJ16]|uniref:hypothetical protein n=1 Tax=Vibrio sp. B1FLJ16 TaxID=2751178 RepID=UPI0015F57909|nr:hypothetical protein [Vibrio sp. B1FLJ16]CAD7822859.1 hypothetical protein ACOMICROBIO_EPCKBFOG_04293 [Vibrio sp. B1FLJ16]CAD7824426.1 hypothetical protein ACOMICROBIO_FLGHMIGD_03323 [Vibrio sp. B1FLJ16]CAE6950270.1 hypothetical protein ACOMICROBIO_EPCKBFOG_04293 [Vibrio sp. B1FLJ16]CAE6954502.1 hypothetical protein ACOMICROBIO_FLGHMIGD_03323 [Vibrio sp. B1FLJ16]